MIITFYKYMGESNRLNKTLTDGVEIEIDFNMNFNIINPIIKLVYDDFDFNYCYVNGKYYFVTNYNITRNGYVVVNMSLDVLMTYKDIILNSTGTVTQSFNNPYLNGNNISTTSKTSLTKYQYNDVFNHDGQYVLITSGYVEG